MMGLDDMKDDDLTIENHIIRASFHPKSGLLKSVFNKQLNRNIDVSQTFDKYDTARSGAYIFRPNMRKGTVTTTENSIRVTRGPILNTLQLRYNRWDGSVTIVGGNDPELVGHLAFNYAIEADPNTE